MTLTITGCIRSNKCKAIVLAADSRCSNNVEVEDTSTKIHQAGNYIGVTNSGRKFVGDQLTSIHSFIDSITAQIKNKDPEKVAEELAMSLKSINSADVSLLIAGYELPGEDIGSFGSFHRVEHNKLFCVPKPDYAAQGSGNKILDEVFSSLRLWLDGSPWSIKWLKNTRPEKLELFLKNLAVNDNLQPDDKERLRDIANRFRPQASPFLRKDWKNTELKDVIETMRQMIEFASLLDYDNFYRIMCLKEPSQKSAFHGIGGPIDIAVIDLYDGFYWHSKKIVIKP